MAISPYIAKLRAHIGHELLLLPSVAACVFDSDHRLLVVLHENGLWAPPGGAIEPDERPAEAVVREVKEEVGLDIEIRGLIGTYGGPEFHVHYRNGDEAAYVITVYACAVTGGRLTPDQDEVTDARFVRADELAALKLSPWFQVSSSDIFEWMNQDRNSARSR